MTQMDLFGQQAADEVRTEAWERVTRLLDGQRRPVSTGFHQIDAALRGGLRRGQVSLISADPGMGSTTLALGMAVRASVVGRRAVTVLTLDDDPADLLIAAMAHQGRVDLEAVMAGDGTDTDRFRLAEAGATLTERGLEITRPSTRDGEVVLAAARAAMADGALDLLVVDALDHVCGLSVLDVAHGLKDLAAQAGTAVVATMHLPAETWERPLREASWISDLGALGPLAQVADAVLFLSRDDRWLRDHPRTGEADLTLAKNPHGAPAATVVAHLPRWAAFRDFPRD